MDHGGFGLIFGLPEAPTAGFAVVLVIVLGYLLLRAYSSTQSKEIDGLRKALDKQSVRHQDDIRELSGRLDGLHEEYLKERSAKHKANNDVARLVTALYLVQRLAQECTCERAPLVPLIEIIDRLLAELETLPRPTTTTTGGTP